MSAIKLRDKEIEPADMYEDFYIRKSHTGRRTLQRRVHQSFDGPQWSLCVQYALTDKDIDQLLAQGINYWPLD